MRPAPRYVGESMKRLCFCLLFASCLLGSAFAQFAGGSGTARDPYLVSNPEQLFAVREFPGAFFAQTADIDLGLPPWNDGEGWIPCDFSGSYQGNGFAVQNLFINRPDAVFQGLFARVYGRIENLELTSAQIVGGEYCGILAGYLNHGSLSGCAAAGSVSGSAQTGGLLGCCDTNGSVGDCVCSASVQGSAGPCGGLIGSNLGRAARCFSSGSVNGSLAGGLAGQNCGEIADSHSAANVSGCGMGGGLTGLNSGQIFNCYSRGSVCGTCAGGMVAGEGDAGSARRSYWDTDAAGTCWSEEGEGRATLQMVFPHDTETYVDWDWHVWKPDVALTANAGYPYLRPVGEIPAQAPEPALPRTPAPLAQDVPRQTVLRWSAGFSPDNADPPDGYRLWLGTDNPPANLHQGTDLGLCQSFSASLDWDTAYFWKIVPYNTLGEASGCPVWTFSTASELSAVPAAVQNVFASVSGNAICLNWQPVATSALGTPLTPAGYLVLASDDPCAAPDSYTELAFVTMGNQFSLDLAQCPARRFFRVVAVGAD